MQADTLSTYVAEDTSFVGFVGEVMYAAALMSGDFGVASQWKRKVLDVDSRTSWMTSIPSCSKLSVDDVHMLCDARGVASPREGGSLHNFTSVSGASPWAKEAVSLSMTHGQTLLLFKCTLHNKVIVFSEGELHLDECDFSGSSAEALVFAGQEENTVIRNAVLGEKNCERRGWGHQNYRKQGERVVVSFHV